MLDVIKKYAYSENNSPIKNLSTDKFKEIQQDLFEKEGRVYSLEEIESAYIYLIK